MEKAPDLNIEVYAELWVNDFYKRTVKVRIAKDKNGEITVGNKKVTIKSYEKACNILELQEYHSDGYWVITEKTSGKDPGEIYRQLKA